MFQKGTTQPQIRIGISGWLYKPWRGVFYPDGLSQKKELEYASRQLNSIEMNGTFYSLKRPNNFRQWYEQTPNDFLFSIKGSRYITHMLKLRNVETPLATFFAQGLLQLGKKLGPFLWQFPPNFKYNPERLEQFFNLLPRTHQQAAEIAKGHDARLNNRALTETLPGLGKRKLRHAIEIRNDSFVKEEFIALLRQHDIALVKADTGRVAPADGCHLRLRLLPSARQRRALRQRLLRRGTRPMGQPHTDLVNRRRGYGRQNSRPQESLKAQIQGCLRVLR